MFSQLLLKFYIYRQFYRVNSKLKHKIIVSVTSDLVSDNRVHKYCSTLHYMGFDVLLIGRKLKNSQPLLTRAYETKRFNLLFNKGPLFYAEFNYRLYLCLLFSKSDILLANDLDTLPANFLASKVKQIPLVYDSHEYFTEVPELVDRPRIKKIWEWIEKKIVPQLKYATTVCNSIAEIYSEKYGTPFRVVRNLPLTTVHQTEKTKTAQTEKIILYQGAVNIGRGLEQVINALHYVENAKLIIAGDGDIKPQLEALVQTKNLQNKIVFTGRLTINELAKLTPTADLGLSVEEDFGLNYRFALPNKLFDYIQAQVPVLVTNLPEMAAVVNRFQVGEITDSLDPVFLAAKISEALENTEKRKFWMANLPIAAAELTWENEEKIIREIFTLILKN
ncbi:MAG TPA: glycosyltransferase [Prolixibacteraceae bacterium]|nr:glycosyltransferase [Prolixibacteraceae bacterium]